MWSRIHKKNKPHRWERWSWDITKDGVVYHRSCKCGAIQRHNKTTGEITIWTPDGLDSGLLDHGLIRKAYEELDG